MSNEALRIDKIISTQTSYSRKDISKLIRQGEVSLNGALVKSASEKADPNKDEIKISGKILHYKKFVYYMMNKPKGVLSASTDKKAKTVVDLLPKAMQRKNLFPAGRLDKDTTGLIIITDDGDFAHRMLSPNKKVYKHYVATLKNAVDEKTKESFEAGIVLSDGTMCQKAFFDIIDSHTASVKICEGKFHQVKKMFSACNNTVVDLKRVCIGELYLDESLKLGEARELTDDEKHSIFGTN